MLEPWLIHIPPCSLLGGFWESSRRLPKFLGSCTYKGDPDKAPGLSLSQPQMEHLGNEPTDEVLSLHLFYIIFYNAYLQAADNGSGTTVPSPQWKTKMEFLIWSGPALPVAGICD